MHKNATQSVGDAATAGLARLGTLVAARMGLHFPKNRQRDLLRGAQALAREHGCEDVEAFLQSLVNAPLTDRQIEVLTAHLTVGETYFFRETKSLEAFRSHVVPALVRERAGGDQRIRLWSAGCSTGEEAYSLAMILDEAVPDHEAWAVDILATDINPRSLEQARRGVYTEWSFRGLPAPLRERYFEPRGEQTFEVRPRFRDRVSFACLNLATDVYPSLQNNTNAMDVIFCRNVLMYFVPERIQKVILSFRHCLVAGGWLVVAPSETSLLPALGFEAVTFEGATLFRKDDRKPAEVPPAAAAAGALRAEQGPSPVVFSGKRLTELYGEALAAYGAGRYAAAAAALQALVGAEGAPVRGVKAGKAMALMARIEANQGKLAPAFEWAGKAIAADKVNPGYYYLLATILEEQHRSAEAVQALKRALYLDPEFVLAHYTLGMIALRGSGFEEADRHFRNAAASLAHLPESGGLPESEGLTVGRLAEIIHAMRERGLSS